MSWIIKYGECCSGREALRHIKSVAVSRDITLQNRVSMLSFFIWEICLNVIAANITLIYF